MTPPGLDAGLFTMWQGQVLLPGTEDVYSSNLFFSFLRQHRADEAAYINPVYSPLFLLKYSFLPAVTGEQIDCVSSLIFCLSCHFEVRDQNWDGTQQWQWSASTYQKLQKQRGPVPHTLRHPVDPVLLRSGGKHSDGIIHSETKILFLIDGAINGQVHCCNLCSRRL